MNSNFSAGGSSVVRQGLVALWLGVCAMAWAQTPPAPVAQPQPVPAGSVTAAPPQMSADGRRDYVIGAGDVLRVSVFQNADLSIETRVSESGAISYPLLGQVRVGGLTIGQVEQAIGDGLRNGNFIKQPQVSVLLVQVRGNQASVLGMAARPGRYPIEVSGMRLSELLALAGGVAPGGSSIVTLSGTRDGKPFRQKLDITALFASGSDFEDPVVLHGDTLYVDRAPLIYVYGEVQRPGPIEMLPDMTLMQAIASGGGLTPRGTERGMRLHRRNPENQKLEVYRPRMDDVLRPGDVVYVRESLF